MEARVKPVSRDEIVDYQTWTEQRSAALPGVLAAKRVRRIGVGDCLTFLFENRLTVRYQIQEMMRVERIVREADIQHEMTTYNQLLGADGQLGCTLLIEVEGDEARALRLRQLMGLPSCLYLRLADGRLVRPTFDAAQVGTDRLSSVQYLCFDCGGVAPVAVGADHPALEAEAILTVDQRQALSADLGSWAPPTARRP